MLFETLESDGITVPADLIDKEIIKNNSPPKRAIKFWKK